MILVSVHLPKTAGSSFLEVLKGHFGGKMLLDYGDMPINTSREKRNAKALADAEANETTDFGKTKCIHGHFLPRKYLPLKKRGMAKFVVWLRDPLQRTISHYYFWKRSYNHGETPDLHRRVVEENWSLERFCFSPEMQNFYSQFLWDFPVGNFDFIGLTENFEKDLKHFLRFFDIPDLGKVPHVNTNPNANNYQVESLFEKNFREFHSLDYHLYKTIAQFKKT